MDAHDTVTVEEGDRYPLRPPNNMKKIYKYIIPAHRAIPSQILIPDGSRFCYAEYMDLSENNYPVFWLWFEVNPLEALHDNRSFIVYGTGWEIPYSYEYLTTRLDKDGFVWHLYEVK